MPLPAPPGDGEQYDEYGRPRTVPNSGDGGVHGGPAQPPVEDLPPEPPAAPKPRGAGAPPLAPGTNWLAQAPTSLNLNLGADPFAKDDKYLKSWYQALLNGSVSLFGPEYMEGQKAQLFQAGQGRLRQATDEITRDALKRGVGRGGIPAEGIQASNRTFQSEYSKGVRDLLIEKQKSDMEMKLRGLEMMQRWLDSRRQYLLQKESNAIQRELGLANIRLGYARIQSERENLEYQIANTPHGGGGGENTDWATILEIINGLDPGGSTGSPTGTPKAVPRSTPPKP